MAFEFFDYKTLLAGARFSVLYLFFGVLFVLNFVVFPLPFYLNIAPAFFAIGIFYWAVYHPSLVPPAFCFVVGILADIIGHYPMGLHAFLFTILQWMVKRQRRFLMGQTYLAKWLAWGVTILIVEILRWIVLEAFRADMVSVSDNIINAVISFLIFPLFNMALVYIHKLLPVASAGYS